MSTAETSTSDAAATAGFDAVHARSVADAAAADTAIAALDVDYDALIAQSTARARFHALRAAITGGDNERVEPALDTSERVNMQVRFSSVGYRNSTSLLSHALGQRSNTSRTSPAPDLLIHVL